MTVPRGAMEFDRAAAKAAGYSDAEIDAFLQPKAGASQPPGFASESTSARGPVTAPHDTSLTGLPRAAAQGATFGFADEIEAGVRSHLPKGFAMLTDGYAGGDYRTIRDDIRKQNDDYSRDHPMASFLANVGGGLLTGSTAMKAAQGVGKLATLGRFLSPTVDGVATVGGRAAQGAKAGLSWGLLSGAGGAKETSDVLPAMGINGVLGTVLGVGGGMAGDVVKGMRNVAGGALRNATGAGPVSRIVRGIGSAVEAEAPATAGARRVLNVIQRGGSTVDDIATRNATAAQPLALAEVVDDAAQSTGHQMQGTQGLRIARNQGRQRDALDASLMERAGDEPARYYDSVAKNTGVPHPQDADAFAARVADDARVTAGPQYEATKHLPVPDGAAATLLNDVAELEDDGLDLWRKARLSNKNFPKQRTDQLTVGDLHTLRKVLDNEIEYGSSREGMSSLQKSAQGRLSELRAYVDDTLKGAGGPAFQQADAGMAKAFESGRSFRTGQDVEKAGSADAIEQLRSEVGDPEAFRQGAASKQLQRAQAVPDGESGITRNPSAPMASPTARLRTREAYPDDASFENVRGDVKDIVRRLATRNRVSGNSSTAANLAEMESEFMVNPGDVVSALASPAKGAVTLLKKLGDASSKGLNADQATEMGRLLGSGLPGQMSRADAIAILREALPKLQAAQRRSLLIRGQIANQTGQRVQP